MTKILAIDWLSLNNLTSKIYSAVKSGSAEYGPIDHRVAKEHGTAHYVVHLNPEIVEQVNKRFPFIEPTLVILEQDPGYITPHIDGTIEWGYPYNLVVPVNINTQTSIAYFENRDLIYLESWKTTGSKFERDLSQLNMIFEFNFTEPIVFFNQQLHTMFNRGQSPVVVGTWKLSKDVNTDIVAEWAKSQGISTKEIY